MNNEDRIVAIEVFKNENKILMNRIKRLEKNNLVLSNSKKCFKEQIQDIELKLGYTFEKNNQEGYELDQLIDKGKKLYKKILEQLKLHEELFELLNNNNNVLLELLIENRILNKNMIKYYENRLEN